MIKFNFVDNVNDIAPYKAQMWELLCLCDKDFYPSLSSRENNDVGPVNYFEGLFLDNAKFLLAFAEEQLVGFSVFLHDYFEPLIAKFTPCNYIKIACVHPSYRGLRIASSFNSFIEENLPTNLVMPYIVRRTWSTNFPQLKLLERNGYNLVHKFENDRGNNISTVYFAKLLEYTQQNLA
ncbi:GNAT family N-acetyltransferase [Sporosalibacterium faouarense]|uniref:GNAT family N-acetyltransferase n=1 Tax=Sporosalibacterium faouarense TaxID=516123 RepID=UPI00192C8E1F|nr:GNAT family N-acetyltransferase [Sporosalibacterium faouarense]